MINAPARRFTPVPFTRVVIDDAFWSLRQRANRERTLPMEYQQCKQTGRIDAFKLTWQPGMPDEPHIFWDSDVAKWVEAASYSLAAHPDPALDAQLDEVVALIAGAQQADGYINCHYSIVEPEQRWSNLRDCHELYCAGHLIEAAVAHFQATGKRALLDVLCRYADYIDSVFGTEAGKKRGYCGHEEIELALVKLYRVSGEARYLRLAQYFIDERGRQPHYFDQEAVARGEDPRAYWAKTYDYCQAQAPVRELTTVGGHAVRAMYLYSAMADLAGELHDDALLAACRRLWDDLCLKKMYLTGGLGPSRINEGFTADYDLPNETAYAETCAAIGLVFWSHRLLQLDCDSRYADALERALYNGVISGVSLNGAKFFYENPLASNGGHHRQDWFGCACCPPNAARLIAAVGEYAYSTGDAEVAVHLYVQGSAEMALAGSAVTLQVQTQYPWDGAIRLAVTPAAPTAFTLRLRIPGWCRRYTLALNAQPLAAAVENGYACITRMWQPGDVVTLELAMPVEQMAAHPNVTADRGQVALQRGPLVYCLEDADHAVSIRQLALSPRAAFTTRFVPELLDGVTVIEGEALAVAPAAWEGTLYQPTSALAPTFTPLRAIPYYAWDNRAAGAMAVWLPVGE